MQRHLAGRVERLEKAVADHDEQIVLIVDAIRLLTAARRRTISLVSVSLSM